MGNYKIEGTGDVNMYQLLKKQIMDLTYGDGEDDDFDTIVEINKTIESIRIRMEECAKSRDNYKKLLFKQYVENDKLLKQIEELQKEKEELEKRIDAADIIPHFDEKF